ncbi:MAG TPA: hypothetical protein VFK02_35115 [Kofleriaceae bacterium]|nr:hypothetical protein [Kofleriaceae bacterium]
MKRSSWLVVLAASACGGGSADRGASVLELHAAPSRAGAYVDAAFTRAAAATLHRDTTFTATYSGAAFAQALYLDRGGAHDLVIAATEANEVSAFDPTGAMVWRAELGTPQPMPNPAEAADCGNINPLGITGTPVIDPGSGTLYLDAMIHDGGAAHHRIFALAVDTGATRPGWPVDVGAALAGGATPFVPAAENQRGGLTLVGGTVYVPYGGHYGDCGHYRGWIVAVPADRPAALTAFATTSTQAGAWTPGGVSSDGTSVFAVFGNGEGSTTWAHSDAILRFGAGATFSGSIRDYWAPTNWQQLDSTDKDLAGPAMPLDLPGATPAALLVAFGKDGNVYLLARDDLGGITAPVAQLHAATAEILNTPTLYRTANGTYVAFRAHGAPGCPGLTGASSLVAVKIAPGTPPQLSLAWCAGTGSAGSPIATTTDGTSDPIVWVVGAEGDQRLHGYDGDTGAVVFAGGGAGDAMASTSRFITPIVARGRIFVAADGQLHAFTTRPAQREQTGP